MTGRKRVIKTLPEAFRGWSGPAEDAEDLGDFDDLDLDAVDLAAERAARRASLAWSLSCSLVGGGEAWMEAEVIIVALTLEVAGESSQREIVWLRVLDRESREVMVVEDGLVEG